MLTDALLIACCAVADDGDSIHADEVYYRLWGIDVPERLQTCSRPGGGKWSRGRAALAAMRDMIAGQAVTC